MPGEVAEILDVWEDGVLLTEGADFRAMNSRRELARVGAAWPTCQDYTAAHDAAGALSIHYVPGVLPGDLGEAAAGVLASEFGYALSGDKKCRLPAAVTSLSRNGITLDFQEGYFPNNVTGLILVDTYVATLNPNSLRMPSAVWSPDLPQGKTTPAPPVGD